jgi:hypothetical protein
MPVTSEPATISIATLAASVDTCELCATPAQTLRSAITVRHFRGGTTSFAACDRCTTALRRVIAAAGGISATGPAAVVVTTPPFVPVISNPSPPELVGVPTLVLEFAEPFIGPDGQRYLVRVWGQGRTDGTWVGWLAFVAAGCELVRVTPRETSQSSLADVRYWASGLQPSFVEGAFQRTETR